MRRARAGLPFRQVIRLSTGGAGAKQAQNAPSENGRLRSKNSLRRGPAGLFFHPVAEAGNELCEDLAARCSTGCRCRGHVRGRQRNGVCAPSADPAVAPVERAAPSADQFAQRKNAQQPQPKAETPAPPEPGARPLAISAEIKQGHGLPGQPDQSGRAQLGPGCRDHGVVRLRSDRLEQRAQCARPASAQGHRIAFAYQPDGRGCAIRRTSVRSPSASIDRESQTRRRRSIAPET